MIKKKFSLMEMLIVMAIMMLLFSIGVVAFGKAASKAEITQCKSELAQLKSAIEMYRDRWGGYPATGEAGVDTGIDFEFAAHLSKVAVGDSRFGTASEKRPMFIDYNKVGFDIDTDGSAAYDDVGTAGDTAYDEFTVYDPWGNPYVYSYDSSTGNFLVVSPGPDNTTASVDWSSGDGVPVVTPTPDKDGGPYTSNGQ